MPALTSVPRFEPFVGLRYDTSQVDLDDVVAPPYDVLRSSEREELASRHAANIVRVDVPPESEGPGRYERAALTFQQWQDDGILRADERPAFTLYRMSFTDEAGRPRTTVGVIGALEVTPENAEPAEGQGVLPHERTTPKDSTDRLELTRATGANLSPIWGLSLAPGLTELLREPGAPLGSTVDDDGVTHTVELVDDPERCAAIGDAVAGHAVLIADGHHRYGVSRQYREERRTASGGRPGPYDLTMTYLGELVEEQLSVAAIHRLLDGLPAGRDWLEILTPWFDTEPAGPATPELAASLVELDAMAFVEDNGTATLLRPRADRFEGVRNLDSVRLEHALTGVPHVLRYEPRVASVLAVLAGGGAQAAVLVRPVSVAEIERTAYEGTLMPPKSTFFTPKLRTGLVVRPFVS